MRMGEFMERTGLSLKTARWLYDNVLNQGRVEKQRTFTEDDVMYVLKRKPENFEAVTGRRLSNIIGASKYFISDNGFVFNYSRGFLEIMSVEINAGYRRVALDLDSGERKHFKVSKLVALHFIPNPENKPIVNHIDGDKGNDDYINLEWCTYSENNIHAFKNGLAHTDSGWDDSQSKPVVMYNNRGEIVSIFGSIREAVRKTGMTLGYISNQARRRVDHGTNGFYFNFLDKEEI